MAASLQQVQQTRSQVACNDCHLGELCIPQGLTHCDVERLSNTVRRNRTLRKGEHIYQAGEHYNSIYALKSGTAKLVHMDRMGSESIVSLLLPGELAGFDGVASGRYLCSVVALETVSFCELPSHQIDRLSREMPALYQVILQRTGGKFDECLERMRLLRRPADQRLAAFLLSLSERYRLRGFSHVEFRLTLTRQEIGDHLGLALETVSRMLGQFESAQLIAIEGKLIRILDEEGLQRYSPR
ncbi:helix-turn-helix domain-containing protein [Methylococcus sp. EFPC2]|uniref:helix-turn-helix domain-containing protein n=1 Tax=Methylococcus sp. EFPC2 TaxID=2812648 RepID=UPI0019687066|nr:helix-turn-helix domain-containing protein [Methylococcus sp. EFPC2]QSA96228.1 helix-turn-helix domain-containing protein [Methylococcus sp. EFPC2]